MSEDFFKDDAPEYSLSATIDAEDGEFRYARPKRPILGYAVAIAAIAATGGSVLALFFFIVALSLADAGAFLILFVVGAFCTCALAFVVASGVSVYLYARQSIYVSLPQE